MHLAQLVLGNSVRSPLRTGMTVLTVGIMLAAIVFPRTMVDAQEDYARHAKADRILVLPRQAWVDGLPVRYAEQIRSLQGIAHTAGMRWAGFTLPGKPDLNFASMAVEPAPFLAIHRELVLPEAEKQAFIADDASMLVSRELAREQGWSLGSRVILKRDEPAFEWSVTIAGVYEAEGAEWARRALWVHYRNLNRALPEKYQDELEVVVAQVANASEVGPIARSIDAHFDAAPVRTRSLEDKVLTASQIGRIGAILRAMDLVSYLVSLVVLAILINTIALNVRERTRELGVLRAIGFGPGHVYFLVLADAALLGLAGSVLGLGLSHLLIEGVVSPVLQDALQFQPIQVPWRVSLAACATCLGLALLAALLPAEQARRLEVREALGRVQ
jgi:putative ABC transport system permease protein